jgi:PAS domain-containing protein
LHPQDLVFIEEAFERLLLDYDRVFASMGIPACLWRRTGEIFKGNTEFAKLIGVDPSDLVDVCLSFCTVQDWSVTLAYRGE